MIVVVKPGVLDLVMDLGRPGFRTQGVPEGGAADAFSLIHANRLVGNPDDAAGLEMTMRGPVLDFPEGAVLAVAGADMPARLDDEPVCVGRQYVAKPGARLEFGMAKSGLRGYLAVRGGIDVPLVLDSRSTFLPGGWGGWQGRPLRAGDRLPVGKAADGASWLRMTEPWLSPGAELRVLPGPQVSGFSDAALVGFLHHIYKVEPESSRVGIRLKGPALTYRNGDIASQAVVPGAIQITPSGQPIMLGWDGPVTGGYPVIAGVIAADLPRLAQLKPGEGLSFRFVDIEEARLAWRQANSRLL